MEIISIHTIEGFRIGHAQNESWGTGCTVVISDEGAAAGVSVRGGGPASRETELLSPTANADCIHALLLSGGSAYGLGAAQGVMALMALMLPDGRQGLFLAMLPVSVLGLFTPGGLIDICRMNTMRCRMLMRPAMLVLFALTLVSALAGCLTSRGRKA